MKKNNNFLYAVIACMALGWSCSKSSDVAMSNETGVPSSGTGGSMARFAIKGNSLFTVNDKELSAYDISDAASPKFLSSNTVGVGIETIFPKGNHLFIGSQFGMYIYDATNPQFPELVSEYRHVFSCDPVVANNDYAFVTLRSSSLGGRCFRGVNQLDIIDIKNLQQPFLQKSYQMQSPKGLGIDPNGLLFICDAGLKVYNATDVNNIQLINHFTNISATDVIPLGDRLLLVGEDGFMQYSYQQDSIAFLSKISVD